MSSCEKCWRDAHSGGPYGDVAARYRRLMEERRDTPCTPEEQAGPYERNVQNVKEEPYIKLLMNV